MTTTQALGWALVHSLWQCALAPAGLAALLSILPSRAARVRYALATATLVLMVAVPLRTALSLHEASPWHGAPAAVLTPAQTLAGPAVVALRLAARVRTALEPALPVIVAVDRRCGRVRAAAGVGVDGGATSGRDGHAPRPPRL